MTKPHLEAYLSHARKCIDCAYVDDGLGVLARRCDTGVKLVRKAEEERARINDTISNQG